MHDDHSSTAEGDAHRLRNGLIWTAALLLLLLAIGLAVPDLRDVIDRVLRAHLGWVLLAVALELASCLGYVATVRLVLNRGPARDIRRLAWAEMAFGAVVPVGGAGGLAVGAWAMRAWGISWARIANRSAVIFLLTSAINTIVLALAGVGLAIGIGSSNIDTIHGVAPAAVAIAVLAFFFFLPRMIASRTPRAPKRRSTVFLHSIAGWVRDTERSLGRPDWRLLGAVGYLLFDIGTLWACLHAFGTSPSVLAVVVGYQIGYLANLVPIPGGVGVLEGGLLGAPLLYGLPAGPAGGADGSGGDRLPRDRPVGSDPRRDVRIRAAARHRGGAEKRKHSGIPRRCAVRRNRDRDPGRLAFATGLAAASRASRRRASA